MLSDEAARRAAKRVGLVACKSRWHRGSTDNQWEFRLIDTYNNIVFGGERYDMTADEGVEYRDEVEKENFEAQPLKANVPMTIIIPQSHIDRLLLTGVVKADSDIVLALEEAVLKLEDARQQKVMVLLYGLYGATNIRYRKLRRCWV